MNLLADLGAFHVVQVAPFILDSAKAMEISFGPTSNSKGHDNLEGVGQAPSIAIINIIPP